MQHQDSHGGGGVIQDGATQWMTAGSGILHIETPPEWLVTKGGLFHGIQLWVNLPAADKWLSPNYQGLEGGDVTLLTSPDGGALIRLIAGDLGGHAGPGSTHTPITMAHLTLQPGAQVRLPWPDRFNGLVYALSGAGTVGPDHRPLASGQLAVTNAGGVLTIGGAASPDARTDAFDVLVLGGQKIGEPVAWQGPFVMNTRAELMAAFQDFEAGKLGVIPHGALGIR
jgi:redox-sensitive bicupin YhaK (pirin superfamily)